MRGDGRTTTFGGLLRIAHLRFFRRFAGRGIGSLHGTFFQLVGSLVRGLHPHLVAGLVLLALAVLLLWCLLRILLARLLAGFVLLGLAFFHHVEGGEQLVNGASEHTLVFDGNPELIEISATALLDERPPEVDDLPRGRRWGEPGQPLAHDHRDRILERCVGAIGDFRVIAAMEAVFEHGGQIAGHAFHSPAADRFDARLLDRLEDGAGRLILRHEPAMHVGVVAGEPQRHGITMAAHDGRFLRGQLAGWLGQTGASALLGADQRRTFRRETDFEVMTAGHGAHATGDRPLERLSRRGLVLRRLAIGRHGRRSRTTGNPAEKKCFGSMPPKPRVDAIRSAPR